MSPSAIKRKPSAGWDLPSFGRLGNALGGSSSGQQASQGDAASGSSSRSLCRSHTAEPVHTQGSFPPGAGRSARSVSLYPGQPGSIVARKAIATDIEAGRAGREGSDSSSSFSMEGRSHRFQPMAHQPEYDFMGSSYTATSDSIRDSTAQLAGMAMRGDDDPNGSNLEPSRIDEEEGEGDEAALSTPISGRQTEFSSSAGQSSVGPSNLARALEASSSISPKDTIRQSNEDGPSSYPVARSPLAERTVISRDDMDQEQQTAPDHPPAHEKTPLISRSPRSRKRQMSPSRSAARDRSQSSSRQGGTDGNNDSEISILSYHERSGAAGRSSYGYGALAQASMAESAANTGVRTEGSALSHYEEPEAESPLPAVWKLWPVRFRPGGEQRPVEPMPSPVRYLRSTKRAISKLTWRDLLDASAEPIRLIPATILGVLMNILDGVSYGLITFPASYPIFADFGGDGVSMFFVTCVIAQLTFTLGGSIFKGGNGSMMIEVVPFYHILCTTIINTIGDDKPQSVIATTMVAFALSSIFTGVAFLLLGVCRLGVLIGFFPRHILVGCIGGVGVFLLETGMEVAGRLEAEAGFQYDLATLRYFFQSWQMVGLWGTPLALTILLRLITMKFHHPLVMPTFFLSITPIFYLIAVVFCGQSVEQLRHDGWIFDIGKAGDAPFWRYLTYLDFSQTSIRALWNTMPTMISLTFFSVLHVPLNVPALGVSLKEDNVNVDRELTGHGISNLLAGLFCTVPNYLCFSNSLLFYRVGGGNTLSGLMLAGATAVVLFVGPGMINYLNVSTVGSLIFLLGIDLCKEAVWDTIGRVNRWEYLTIWFIIIVMSLADFVIGILAGICLACLFLTVQMSRRKTVRACFDGSIARSTVRRPMTQRKFLEAVGTQTQILKLQGFLFFATINSVEALIRRALDIATWQHKPMRFLVIDFSLVSGVDFSASEAFTRIQRLLEAKDVVLVFCGLQPDGEIGVALRSVGLWADQGLKVEAFPSLNEALEWAENSYLRGMYTSSLKAGKQLKTASLGAHGALDVPDTKRKPAFVLDEAFENSPRRHHLHEAAKTAVKKGQLLTPSATRAPSPSGGQGKNGEHGSQSRSSVAPSEQHQQQPLPLLMATFGAYASSDMDEGFFQSIVPYFTRVELLREELLWQLGDEPDGFYLIESGALKARYDFEQEDFEINEAMLAGTIAGELSFLSRQARNTTTRAELNSVLWKLDSESLARLEKEEPRVFFKFVALLLRVTGEEQDSLMSYLVSRLS